MDLDSIRDLVQGLPRRAPIFLRADLTLSSGRYELVSCRPDYVKLQRGSSAPVKITYDRLASLIDDSPGFPPGMGVLGALGYRVGRNGLSLEERHRILEDALTRPLELLPNATAVDHWNQPRTPWRFNKIVRCLESFAENARGRRSQLDAVRDWEVDLDWLMRRFGAEFGYKYPPDPPLVL